MEIFFGVFSCFILHVLIYLRQFGPDENFALFMGMGGFEMNASPQW